MTSTDLKIVAITSMLIDHVGAVFFPQLLWLRLIGRIAFPIFAFLIVEGYVHTKDFNKYMTRLFIFALISEVPFDYAFTGKIFSASHQNVLFTFVLGLIILYFIDNSKSEIIKGLVFLGVFSIAYITNVDYSIYGLLMILIYYVHRDKKLLKYVLIILVNLLIAGLMIVETRLSLFTLSQAFAFLAIPFIIMYNGKRGRNMKYLFYAFYPVHLAVIGLIRYL